MSAVALKHNADREELQRYKSYIEQSSEGIFCQEMRSPIPVNLPLEKFIEEASRQSYISECNKALAQMYGYENAAELMNYYEGKNTRGY